MATLMDADLPSDDEEDEDFNPTGAEFKGPAKSARAKRGLMEISDDEDGASQPTAGDGLHRMLADKLADAMDEARYTQPPPGGSSEDEEGGRRHKGKRLHARRWRHRGQPCWTVQRLPCMVSLALGMVAALARVSVAEVSTEGFPATDVWHYQRECVVTHFRK